MRFLYLIVIVCLFLSINSFGHTQQKIGIDVSLQGVKMLYDNSVHSYSNLFWSNEGLPMGFDLKLVVVLNPESKLSPQLSLGTTVFTTRKFIPLATPAVPNKYTYVSKSPIHKAFMGFSYEALPDFNISYTIGACLINSNYYLGMKPELNYSFGKEKRVKFKLSWTHIRYSRFDKVVPFGFLGLGFGYRLPCSKKLRK